MVLWLSWAVLVVSVISLLGAVALVAFYREGASDSTSTGLAAGIMGGFGIGLGLPVLAWILLFTRARRFADTGAVTLLFILSAVAVLAATLLAFASGVSALHNPDVWPYGFVPSMACAVVALLYSRIAWVTLPMRRSRIPH